jgi:sulfite reductase alpha subunit-like flavoprotein
MIYILYGSQSGNCESISKMLYELLINETDSITYGTLNSVVNNIESINGTVYIMCSTFGNGDAPENADAFWRCIKNRKLNNKFFANINYMVLGLGNSNYSHFCDMGKKIDKRLGELGGKRIKPLVCVDEVGGLEEPVELWLQQFKQ